MPIALPCDTCLIGEQHVRFNLTPRVGRKQDGEFATLMWTNDAWVPQECSAYANRESDINTINGLATVILDDYDSSQESVLLGVFLRFFAKFLNPSSDQTR